MATKRFILKKTIVFVLCSLVFLGCSEKETNSEYKTAKKETTFIHFYPTNIDTKELHQHHTIYLPVYSHVYTSESRNEPLGITLSIRNTDATQNLFIEKISYFDTYGKLVDSYIEKPHILHPMASIDFVVDLRDMRGGSGANFIVKWAGEEDITMPIIQAVMVNNSGNRSFGFVTNGHFVK